jgi:hypothetical protein
MDATRGGNANIEPLPPSRRCRDQKTKAKVYGAPVRLAIPAHVGLQSLVWIDIYSQFRSGRHPEQQVPRPPSPVLLLLW